MKRFLWLTALVVFTSDGVAARAADNPSSPIAPVESRKYTVYFDGSTLLVIGSASLNVEAPLGVSTLLRLGAGLGYMADNEGGIVPSSGLLAMVSFFTDRTRTGFECGAGGSIVKIHESDGCCGYLSSPGWRLYPSFTLGYRHEPPSGGFLFRTGAGYTYAHGMGPYVSLGVSR